MTPDVTPLIAALEAVQDSRTLGARLQDLCTDDVLFRSAWGQARGVGEAEMALLPLSLCLPDLRISVEDALSSAEDPSRVVLRLVVQGTHSADGWLGAASHKVLRVHAMAELVRHPSVPARISQVDLVMDTAGLVAQSGQDPDSWTATHGVAPLALSEPDPGPEGGQWGRAWRALVGQALAGQDIAGDLAPACQSDWPAQVFHGAADSARAWLDLSSALPDAQVSWYHVMGADTRLLPPRASVRWRLEGLHSGWGALGAPTGRAVRVDGVSQAEFGADGVTRIWTVFDKLALGAAAPEPTAGQEP